MDTKFLESLIAVAETGSIAAAARAQGLTAAAVSQRVRVLERELDCHLLNRSAHSAEPSSECLRLLPAARDLVRGAARLRAHADASGLRGPYRLGAVSTALLSQIPEIIRTFRDKAPEVDLSVRPGTSTALYNDLLAGELDAAITVMPPFGLPKALDYRLLEDQTVVHIRPRKEVPGGTEDADLPWVIYDRNSWGGRIIWEACRSQLERSQILCELDALETILMMVIQGSGQAMVPLWRSVREQKSLLRIDQVQMAKPISRRMVLLYRRASATSALSTLAVSALQPVA